MRFDFAFTKTVRQTDSQRDDRCLLVRVTAYTAAAATVNLTASEFGLGPRAEQRRRARSGHP